MIDPRLHLILVALRTSSLRQLTFLSGASGGIHRQQLDSIIAHIQLVNVAGVTRAAGFDDENTANAFFARVFLQFSHDQPGVDQRRDADFAAGVVLRGGRDQAREKTGDEDYVRAKIFER